MTKITPAGERALSVLHSARTRYKTLRMTLEKEARERVKHEMQEAQDEIDMLITKARNEGVSVRRIGQAYGSSNPNVIYESLARFNERIHSGEEISEAVKEVMTEALGEAQAAWDEQEIRRYRPGVSEEESSVFNPVKKSNRPRGMHGYPDTGEIEEWIDYHANYSDQDWMGQTTTVTRPYTDINGNEWGRGEA